MQITRSIMGVTAFLSTLLVVSGIYFFREQQEEIPVSSFDGCVLSGGPVMESYPRQCRYGETTYTEDVGNELEKTDFIRVSSPRPNQVIHSPLVITGDARGTWFFEGSFPVVLVDWDGRIIASGIAHAKDSDWMTEEFVPFEANLTFTVDTNTYSNRGALILRKDNPSGLPEHDDAVEMPIVFGEIPETAEIMAPLQ